MRIGVWHDLPTGGGRRAFEDHCASLHRLGHELVVVAPKRREPAPTLPSGTREIPLPIREFRWGSPGANLPAAHGTYARVRNMDRHLALAAEALNELRADVIFVNTSRLVRTPDLAGRLSAPTVLFLQEPYRWFYEALPELPWTRPETGPASKRLKRVINQWTWSQMMTREIRAAARYDRILVNSLFSRESLLRAYGIEARVCRLGIDTSLFSPGSEPRRNHVVMVGALMPEKRQLECVIAVGEVPADLRPTLICVSNVTSGPYSEEVESAARRLGVELRLLTAVSDAELLGWLRSAKALLYAPRLEPFGLAPVEASATATPVVGVAEGGVRETVVDGETGLLVEDGAALGSALTRLLADPELAARLGRRGREVAVAQWDRELAGQRLEAELLEAAGSR